MQGITTKAVYWEKSDFIEKKLITSTISNENPLLGGAKEPDKIIKRLSPQGLAKVAAKSKIAIKNLSIELSGEPLYLYDATDVLLQNCVVTSKSVLTCIKVDSSKNVQILNCTIANGALGVSILWGPVDLTIKNSIFYNNGTAIMIWDNPLTADMMGRPEAGTEKLSRQPREDVKLTLFYNDFWNKRDCYNCQKGEHDITKDPQFLDPKKPDFHLSGSSPCIDAGDPDQKYNDPDGSRNDMGAFPAGKKK